MLSHHHQLYSSFLLAKQAVDDLYTSVYQACGGAHVQDNSREAWMTATGVQSTADGLQGAARDLLDGARLSLLQLHDAIVLGAADPVSLVQAGARLAHLARTTQLELEASRGSLQPSKSSPDNNAAQPPSGIDHSSPGTTTSNTTSAGDAGSQQHDADHAIGNSNTSTEGLGQGSLKRRASLFRRLVYPSSPPARDQPAPADAQQSSLAQAAIIEASRQAGTESAPAQLRPRFSISRHMFDRLFTHDCPLWAPGHLNSVGSSPAPGPNTSNNASSPTPLLVKHSSSNYPTASLQRDANLQGQFPAQLPTPALPTHPSATYAYTTQYHNSWQPPVQLPPQQVPSQAHQQLPSSSQAGALPPPYASLPARYPYSQHHPWHVNPADSQQVVHPLQPHPYPSPYPPPWTSYPYPGGPTSDTTNNLAHPHMHHPSLPPHLQQQLLQEQRQQLQQAPPQTYNMSATQPSMNPAYTSSAAGRPGQPARLHPSNTDALRGSSGGGAHSPRSMQGSPRVSLLSHGSDTLSDSSFSGDYQQQPLNPAARKLPRRAGRGRLGAGAMAPGWGPNIIRADKSTPGTSPGTSEGGQTGFSAPVSQGSASWPAAPSLIDLASLVPQAENEGQVQQGQVQGQGSMYLGQGTERPWEVDQGGPPPGGPFPAPQEDPLSRSNSLPSAPNSPPNLHAALSSMRGGIPPGYETEWEMGINPFSRSSSMARSAAGHAREHGLYSSMDPGHTSSSAWLDTLAAAAAAMAHRRGGTDSAPFSPDSMQMGGGSSRVVSPTWDQQEGSAWDQDGRLFESAGGWRRGSSAGGSGAGPGPARAPWGGDSPSTRGATAPGLRSIQSHDLGALLESGSPASARMHAQASPRGPSSLPNSPRSSFGSNAGAAGSAHPQPDMPLLLSSASTLTRRLLQTCPLPVVHEGVGEGTSACSEAETTSTAMVDPLGVSPGLSIAGSQPSHSLLTESSHEASPPSATLAGSPTSTATTQENPEGKDSVGLNEEPPTVAPAATISAVQGTLAAPQQQLSTSIMLPGISEMTAPANLLAVPLSAPANNNQQALQAVNQQEGDNQHGVPLEASTSVPPGYPPQGLSTPYAHPWQLAIPPPHPYPPHLGPSATSPSPSTPPPMSGLLSSPWLLPGMYPYGLPPYYSAPPPPSFPGLPFSPSLFAVPPGFPSPSQPQSLAGSAAMPPLPHPLLMAGAWGSFPAPSPPWVHSPSQLPGMVGPGMAASPAPQPGASEAHHHPGSAAGDNTAAASTAGLQTPARSVPPYEHQQAQSHGSPEQVSSSGRDSEQLQAVGSLGSGLVVPAVGTTQPEAGVAAAGSATGGVQAQADKTEQINAGPAGSLHAQSVRSVIHSVTSSSGTTAKSAYSTASPGDAGIAGHSGSAIQSHGLVKQSGASLQSGIQTQATLEGAAISSVFQITDIHLPLGTLRHGQRTARNASGSAGQCSLLLLNIPCPATPQSQHASSSPAAAQALWQQQALLVLQGSRELEMLTPSLKGSKAKSPPSFFGSPGPHNAPPVLHASTAETATLQGPVAQGSNAFSPGPKRNSSTLGAPPVWAPANEAARSTALAPVTAVAVDTTPCLLPHAGASVQGSGSHGYSVMWLGHSDGSVRPVLVGSQTSAPEGGHQLGQGRVEHASPGISVSWASLLQGSSLPGPPPLIQVTPGRPVTALCVVPAMQAGLLASQTPYSTPARPAAAGAARTASAGGQVVSAVWVADDSEGIALVKCTWTPGTGAPVLSICHAYTQLGSAPTPVWAGGRSVVPPTGAHDVIPAPQLATQRSGSLLTALGSLSKRGRTASAVLQRNGSLSTGLSKAGDSSTTMRRAGSDAGPIRDGSAHEGYLATSKTPQQGCVPQLLTCGELLLVACDTTLYVMQAATNTLLHAAEFPSYGPCTSLSTLHWTTPALQPASDPHPTSPPQAPASASSASTSSPSPPQESSGSLPTQLRSSPPRMPASQSSLAQPCRLITGHATGVILVWDFTPLVTAHQVQQQGSGVQTQSTSITSPDSAASIRTGSMSTAPSPGLMLSPYALGCIQLTGTGSGSKPGSAPSAITSLHVSQELGAVVTTHEDGTLRLAPAPVPALFLASLTRQQSQLLSQLVFSSQKEAALMCSPPVKGEISPGADGMECGVQLPLWRVRQHSVAAHHSATSALTVQRTTAVTASTAGGLKVWDLTALARSAQAAGILPAKVPPELQVTPPHSHITLSHSNVTPHPSSAPAGQAAAASTTPASKAAGLFSSHSSSSSPPTITSAPVTSPPAAALTQRPSGSTNSSVDRPDSAGLEGAAPAAEQQPAKKNSGGKKSKSKPSSTIGSTQDTTYHNMASGVANDQASLPGIPALVTAGPSATAEVKDHTQSTAGRLTVAPAVLPAQTNLLQQHAQDATAPSADTTSSANRSQSQEPNPAGRLTQRDGSPDQASPAPGVYLPVTPPPPGLPPIRTSTSGLGALHHHHDSGLSQWADQAAGGPSTGAGAGATGTHTPDGSSSNMSDGARAGVSKAAGGAEFPGFKSPSLERTSSPPGARPGSEAEGVSRGSSVHGSGNVGWGAPVLPSGAGMGGTLYGDGVTSRPGSAPGSQDGRARSGSADQVMGAVPGNVPSYVGGGSGTGNAAVTNRQGSNDSAASKQDSQAASYLSASSAPAPPAAVRQDRPIERLLLVPPGSPQSRATREAAMVSGAGAMAPMGYQHTGSHHEHGAHGGYHQHGMYHDGGGSSATAVQVRRTMSSTSQLSTTSLRSDTEARAAAQVREFSDRLAAAAMAGGSGMKQLMLAGIVGQYAASQQHNMSGSMASSRQYSGAGDNMGTSQGTSGAGVALEGSSTAAQHTRIASGSHKELVQAGHGAGIAGTGTKGGHPGGSSGASQMLMPGPYADKFIKRHELRLVEEIGRGAEGSVWRGRWHHIDVAVKEMHPQSPSFSRLASLARDLSGQGYKDKASGRRTMLDAIIQEVATLVDVSQHPNIVRFIGVCVDPPRIVTEYYPLGSLFGMISAAREGNHAVIRSLSWPRRLQMLHDVAAGMSYLHARSYMHGDLRTPNVFVASDGRAKIGDFGFARLLGDLEEAAGGAAHSRTTNPRWLAPEVLRTGKSSKAADVFSFGIIMWELLTWQVPYTGYYSVQVTFNHVRDGFRPEIPPDSQLPVSPRVNLAPYKALMAECWAQDPDARPPFNEVVARLSALMHWQFSQAARHKPAAISGGGGTKGHGGGDGGRDGEAAGSRRNTRGSSRLQAGGSVSTSNTGGAAAGPSATPAAAGTTSAALEAGAGSENNSRGRARPAVTPSDTSAAAAGGDHAGRAASQQQGSSAVTQDAGRAEVAARDVQQRPDALAAAVHSFPSHLLDESLTSSLAGVPVGSTNGVSRGGSRDRALSSAVRDHEAAFKAPAMPTPALTTSITPAAAEWLNAAMRSAATSGAAPPWSTGAGGHVAAGRQNPSTSGSALSRMASSAGSTLSPSVQGRSHRGPSRTSIDAGLRGQPSVAIEPAAALARAHAAAAAWAGMGGLPPPAPGTSPAAAKDASSARGAASPPNSPQGSTQMRSQGLESQQGAIESPVDRSSAADAFQVRRSSLSISRKRRNESHDSPAGGASEPGGTAAGTAGYPQHADSDLHEQPSPKMAAMGGPEGSTSALRAPRLYLKPPTLPGSPHSSSPWSHSAHGHGSVTTAPGHTSSEAGRIHLAPAVVPEVSPGSHPMTDTATGETGEAQPTTLSRASSMVSRTGRSHGTGARPVPAVVEAARMLGAAWNEAAGDSDRAATDNSYNNISSPGTAYTEPNTGPRLSDASNSRGAGDLFGGGLDAAHMAGGGSPQPLTLLPPVMPLVSGQGAGLLGQHGGALSRQQSLSGRRPRLSSGSNVSTGTGIGAPHAAGGHSGGSIRVPPPDVVAAAAAYEEERIALQEQQGSEQAQGPSSADISEPNNADPLDPSTQQQAAPGQHMSDHLRNAVSFPSPATPQVPSRHEHTQLASQQQVVVQSQLDSPHHNLGAHEATSSLPARAPAPGPASTLDRRVPPHADEVQGPAVQQQPHSQAGSEEDYLALPLPPKPGPQQSPAVASNQGEQPVLSQQGGLPPKILGTPSVMLAMASGGGSATLLPGSASFGGLAAGTSFVLPGGSVSAASVAGTSGPAGGSGSTSSLPQAGSFGFAAVTAAMVQPSVTGSLTASSTPPAPTGLPRHGVQQPSQAGSGNNNISAAADRSEAAATTAAQQKEVPQQPEPVVPASFSPDMQLANPFATARPPMPSANYQHLLLPNPFELHPLPSGLAREAEALQQQEEERRQRRRKQQQVTTPEAPSPGPQLPFPSVPPEPSSTAAAGRASEAERPGPHNLGRSPAAQQQALSAMSTQELGAPAQPQVTKQAPGKSTEGRGGDGNKAWSSAAPGFTVAPAAAGAGHDQIPLPPLPMAPAPAAATAGQSPPQGHQQQQKVAPTGAGTPGGAAPLSLPFTLSPAFAAYLDSHPPDATWSPPSPVAGPSPPASPYPTSPTPQPLGKGVLQGGQRVQQTRVPGGVEIAAAGGSHAGSHTDGLSAVSGMQGGGCDGEPPDGPPGRWVPLTEESLHLHQQALLQQQQSEGEGGDATAPGPGLGQGHPFLEHAVAAAQEAAVEAAAAAHQQQQGKAVVSGDGLPLLPLPPHANTRGGSALASHPIVNVGTPRESPASLTAHPQQQQLSGIGPQQLNSPRLAMSPHQAGHATPSMSPVASTTSASGRSPSPQVSPFLQASQLPLDPSKQSPPTSPTAPAVPGVPGGASHHATSTQPVRHTSHHSSADRAPSHKYSSGSHAHRRHHKHGSGSVSYTERSSGGGRASMLPPEAIAVSPTPSMSTPFMAAIEAVLAAEAAAAVTASTSEDRTAPHSFARASSTAGVPGGDRGNTGAPPTPAVPTHRTESSAGAPGTGNGQVHEAVWSNRMAALGTRGAATAGAPVHSSVPAGAVHLLQRIASEAGGSHAPRGPHQSQGSFGGAGDMSGVGPGSPRVGRHGAGESSLGGGGLHMQGSGSGAVTVARSSGGFGSINLQGHEPLGSGALHPTRSSGGFGSNAVGGQENSLGGVRSSGGFGSTAIGQESSGSAALGVVRSSGGFGSMAVGQESSLGIVRSSGGFGSMALAQESGALGGFRGSGTLGSVSLGQDQGSAGLHSLGTAPGSGAVTCNVAVQE